LLVPELLVPELLVPELLVPEEGVVPLPGVVVPPPEFEFGVETEVFGSDDDDASTEDMVGSLDGDSVSSTEVSALEADDDSVDDFDDASDAG
jgi:hypothetical protein